MSSFFNGAHQRQACCSGSAATQAVKVKHATQAVKLNLLLRQLSKAYYLSSRIKPATKAAELPAWPSLQAHQPGLAGRQLGPSCPPGRLQRVVQASKQPNHLVSRGPWHLRSTPQLLEVPCRLKFILELWICATAVWPVDDPNFYPETHTLACMTTALQRTSAAMVCTAKEHVNTA